MRSAWLLLLLFVPAVWGADPPPAAPPPVAQLLKDLGADQFTLRRAARDQLLDRIRREPEATLRSCVEAYTRADDPEVQHQLRTLLRQAVVELQLAPTPGYLGIEMAPSPNPLVIGEVTYAPIVVNRVVADTPAAAAGLAAGDLLIAIDQKLMQAGFGVGEFVQYVQSRRTGQVVALRYWRDGAAVEQKITLGKLPEELQRPPGGGQPGDPFERWLAEQQEAAKSAPPK